MADVVAPTTIPGCPGGPKDTTATSVMMIESTQLRNVPVVRTATSPTNTESTQVRATTTPLDAESLTGTLSEQILVKAR
jgi:hypothetical protein